MPTNAHKWSLRQIFLTTAITLITIISILSYFFFATEYTNIHNDFSNQRIKHWSNVLVEEGKTSILKSDRKQLIHDLEIIKKIPNLSYLHIYTLDANTNKTTLLYSYKRNKKRMSIASKAHEIKELMTPRMIKDHIEYMQKIEHNNKLVGYIYLRVTNDYFRLFTDKLINISAILFVFILIIALIIGLLMELFISKPLASISRLLHHATRYKDFNKKCKAMPYRDVDILANNINIMFSRISKYIEQLKKAEQESTEHSLELESIINKRTAALKESNQELVSTLEKMHQFQGQLVESEKMASLGELVAGIAHEVNTPIGLGITASSILNDRLNEISSSFNDKTLKSSHLKKFIDESTEHIAIINRNLNRAAKLISTFKKVAVGQSDEKVSQFNVREVLDDVLFTLKPQLDNLPHNIIVNCPDELIIKSKIGPINQIFINLIRNSIIHAFDNIEQGNITIAVMRLSNQLNIQYQDDGNGIDETIKDKVFEPFTTTKRGEGGSGLGLHLVYNLVTQALGGTITLKSKPHQGVSYDINFPLSDNK